MVSPTLPFLPAPPQPPVASDCHKSRDFCVLITGELSMSSTVLGMEGRLSAYLLDGQILGLPFTTLLCVLFFFLFPDLASSWFTAFTAVEHISR